jgi:hypothetical protein
MKTIKSGGKKYEYPTEWGDLKFKTFLELIDFKLKKIDAIKIILESIGLHLESGDKLEGLETIMSASAFLDKTPEPNAQPERLGEYVFPKDITFETIEQFEDVRSEIERISKIENNLREQSEALAYYAAVYCQGQKEHYDSEKAKFLAKTFLEYPCLEVMAAGSFFQAKCLSMQSGLSMNSLRANIRMKKNRQGLNLFQRLLVLPRLWIQSRVM